MVEIIFAVVVTVAITTGLIASQYTGRRYSKFLKKLEEE